MIEIMEKARTRRLQTLVSPDEEKIIERAAKARGWTISEYLRAASLTCTAIEGDTSALRLVGSAFVQSVRDTFSGIKAPGIIKAPNMKTAGRD
jgi:uncharacterized protein (DUF1778 family)